MSCQSSKLEPILLGKTRNWFSIISASIDDIMGLRVFSFFGAKFQCIAVTPKLFFKASFSLELIALTNASVKRRLLRDKDSYCMMFYF